jgi:hypothetical protein
MMSKTFILLAMMVLTACGKGKSVKFYPATEDQFSEIVNSKNLYANPNLTLDKAFVNNDYPIEIALYKDNKFFYNLPNLGIGVGDWAYDKGHLKLTTKRKIFDMDVDMKIEVHALDDLSKNLAIRFIDRFGIRILKVQKENM